MTFIEKENISYLYNYKTYYFVINKKLVTFQITLSLQLSN